MIQYKEGKLAHNLVLRVQDTGGQPVFLSILELLTTAAATVYLVVISLSDLENDFETAVEEVAAQLLSIFSVADEAPVILAGTRKDSVKGELGPLSERLRKELRRRCGSAVGKLVPDRSASGGELCFFGIENSRGISGDATIRALVGAIEETALRLPTMEQRVPQPWLRVFDRLQLEGKKRRHVTLDEVQAIAETCGLPSAGLSIDVELTAMLSFFHGLNAVLWHGDQPSLRNLVILDLQWVLDAITCFVRDFENKDHTSRCERLKACDERAVRTQPEAWGALTKGSAVLRRALLELFWSQPEFAPQKNELLDMMERFSLLVPLPEREGEWLVPALLQQQSLMRETQPAGWPAPRDDANAPTVRLHFSLAKQRSQGGGGAPRRLVVDAHFLADGFLPIGVFHRLCAAALGSVKGSQVALYREAAYVALGDERVLLRYVASQSSIIVTLCSADVDDVRCGRVVDRLRVLVAQQLAAYANVRCDFYVPLPDDNSRWVDLDELPKAPIDRVIELRVGSTTVRRLRRHPRLSMWLTRQCDFYFILAEPLRRSTKTTLPRMLSLQEMRKRHPDWVVKKEIRLDAACRAEYATDYLAVSHRWEERGEPDPSGEQLDALRRTLGGAPQVQWVFYDLMCLPQGADKTPEEKAEFSLMLPNINLLYMGARVLILLDNEYLERFWTQFEAWLSFQLATCDGLKGDAEAKRCIIECLEGTTAYHAEALRSVWCKADADSALKLLGDKDIKVTNLSDKEVQLPKIHALDDMVKHEHERGAAAAQAAAVPTMAVEAPSGEDAVKVAQLTAWLSSACSLGATDAAAYSKALVADGVDKVADLTELEEADWPAVVKKLHRKKIVREAAAARKSAATKPESAEVAELQALINSGRPSARRGH